MWKWWPWHRANQDAIRDLERAQHELDEVRRRWPAVHQAADLMREHRERNGFANAIRTAMGVREP